MKMKGKHMEEWICENYINALLYNKIQSVLDIHV